MDTDTLRHGYSYKLVNNWLQCARSIVNIDYQYPMPEGIFGKQIGRTDGLTQ